MDHVVAYSRLEYSGSDPTEEVTCIGTSRFTVPLNLLTAAIHLGAHACGMSLHRGLLLEKSVAKTRADARRESLRESLWPGQGENVWGGPSEKGYWCAPRTLPLLLNLTSNRGIVGELDCSSAFLDLLSRDFGQGVVEILDEEEHAFFAGYTGRRARRTWQERIKRLEKAGFIKLKPRINRPIGYVLINHPYKVAVELRRAGKIDDQWWQLFRQRLNDLGAGDVLERFEESISAQNA